MDNILEIRGGDISCVYHKVSGTYEVYITRYGERGRFFFDNLDDVCIELKECYDFDDELISDFKQIIIEVND